MNEKKKSEPKIVARGDRKYTKERLIAVASFASTLEAQFSKGVLEAEGIESIITNADTVMLSGRNSSTVTPIKLLVKESDAEAANEILNSIEKDISEDDLPPEEKPG
jgi:hypothetical protein